MAGLAVRLLFILLKHINWTYGVKVAPEGPIVHHYQRCNLLVICEKVIRNAVKWVQN